MKLSKGCRTHIESTGCVARSLDLEGLTYNCPLKDDVSITVVIQQSTEDQLRVFCTLRV
jgi:hypothetical protein